MSKKFFDILPPKKVEDSKSIPSRATLEQPKKRIKIKKIWLFLILVLIGIGIIYCSVFSKVEIEIWPKLDTFKSEIEITVDEKAKDPNFSAKIIPGYLLEEENSLSQQFTSSGKAFKSKKAQGIIRVYNISHCSFFIF